MPKNTDAVIIVPTQGHAHGSFQAVAQALKTQVYHGRATIAYAVVSEKNGIAMVTLFTDKKLSSPFTFTAGQGLKTVMTISHGASDDGPNFAPTDATVPVLLHQPWALDQNDKSKLSAEAEAFWKSVGKALKANGKIILLGCSMGAGNYDDLVTAASGRTVYAATDKIGAGDKSVAVPTVRKIENNTPSKIMNRVNAVPTSTN
jgi:hypothetical protein